MAFGLDENDCIFSHARNFNLIKCEMLFNLGKNHLFEHVFKMHAVDYLDFSVS